MYRCDAWRFRIQRLDEVAPVTIDAPAPDCQAVTLADLSCGNRRAQDAEEEDGHDGHDGERWPVFEKGRAAQNDGAHQSDEVGRRENGAERVENAGIVSRGKMKPEKKTLGRMKAIDICSACIWFSALVATSRPRLSSAKT